MDHDQKSSEFHEKTAAHHRNEAKRNIGLSENGRRMEELRARWHDDRAQRCRVIEERDK